MAETPTQTAHTPPSPYERDITVAKGMGIFLVVLAHILARGHSEGNAWFTSLTEMIYLFHMPFFMFLSGLVFFKPGRVERLYADYHKHVNGQVFRLLVPFIALGVLVTMAKFVVAGILHVDNLPESPVTGLVNILWYTNKSPSQFIWYVFVLFIYSLSIPVLMGRFRVGLHMLLLLAVAIHFIPAIPYFYLNLLTYFLLFFVLGGMARHYYPVYQRYLERYGLTALLVFALGLGIYWVDIDYRYQKLLAGLLSLPALHWVARWLAERGNRFFEVLGEYTYSIYLFNTLSIGVVKGVIFHFTHWHGWHFYVIMPVLLAAGLIIPIVLRKLVLSRLPYVDKMTA